MSGEIPGVRAYSATAALGVADWDRYAGYAALPGEDAAADWLRANDPRLREDGVLGEVEAALATERLSLNGAKAAFPKAGGKPTKQRLEVRARVARALLPLWDDDHRRDFMAAALGCDRKTLRRLMANRPTSPYM